MRSLTRSLQLRLILSFLALLVLVGLIRVPSSDWSDEGGQRNQQEAKTKKEKMDHIGSNKRGPISLFPAQFVTPSRVKSVRDNTITVGFIMTNPAPQTSGGLEPQFEARVTACLESLLTHASSPSLHMVVVTNKVSLGPVATFLSWLVARRLAEDVIRGNGWRWRARRGLPSIQVSLVDCQAVVDTDRELVTVLQEQHGEGQSYNADLFYLAPLYHRALTGLDRIIFLDSKDLEFRVDILRLEEQFNMMGETQVLGVGLDLTPHYRSGLTQYLRNHPATELGLPGPKQGLNTGVVLFRLDRMRNSTLLNNAITPDGVRSLVNEFSFPLNLGDQDWVTMLGWRHPSLFHLLPCQLNYQTSLLYLAIKSWADDFPSYHSCPSPRLVLHRNGCGPTPSCCGLKGDNRLFDPQLDFELFWPSLSSLPELEFGTKFQRFSHLLRSSLIIQCEMSAYEFCVKVGNGTVPIN